MFAPLDVFAVRNQRAEWVGCAETLAKALELMSKAGTGSYFVFSEETNHKDFFEISPNGVLSLVLNE